MYDDDGLADLEGAMRKRQRVQMRSMSWQCIPMELRDRVFGFLGDVEVRSAEEAFRWAAVLSGVGITCEAVPATRIAAFMKAKCCRRLRLDPKASTPKVLREVLALHGFSLTSIKCLQEFEAERCDLLPAQVEALAKAVLKSDSLRLVNLGGNLSLGDDGARCLGTSLKDQLSLHELVLWGCGIGAEGSKELAKGLSENRALVALDLSDNTNIGDIGAIALAGTIEKAHTKLKQLTLWNCGISSSGMLAFGKALRPNTCLQKLCLRGNTFKGNTCAEGFSKALCENVHLKELNLASCGIQGTDIVLLAQGLAENKSLSSLNLNANKELGTTGADALGVALQTNSSLKRLELEQCGIDHIEGLCKGIAHNAGLKVLNLKKNCEIGDFGVELLGSSFSTNSTLEHCYMSICGFSSSAALSISQGLVKNRTLVEIDLSLNKAISDEGAIALGVALRDSHGIQKLDLTNTGITTHGAVALAQGLLLNRHLHSVRLDSNQIGDEGGLAFLPIVERKSSLEILGLQWCNLSFDVTRALESATHQHLYVALRGNR